MSRLTRAVCLSLLLLALVGAMCPVPARASAESHPAALQVWATGYTCDPASPSDYPMTNTPGMCEVTAYGGNIYAPGLACPEWMRGAWYDVPGHGRLQCDDTGPYDTWEGLLHVDVRTVTYGEAQRIYGPMTIYPVVVATVAPVPAATPAPTPAPVAVERWEVYHRYREHVVKGEVIPPPPSVPVWVARMIDVR